MFSIGGYLKKHGARPSVIFNVFENQPREKALLLGIKRHFPQTAVWGYQHSTIPYLWVGYFPSKRDIEYQIFPDRIIANGPVWKDLLILRGIPSNRIDIGASLRYSHIFEQTESGPDDHPHSSHPTDHVILLALPYYYPVSLECLIKTVQAFYDTPDIQVQIKFHPLMSGTIENCFDIVQQTLGLDSIPPHIQVVDQPISSLLHSTHLLLYSGTTVGFEFLTQGIPVIMIQSDLRIDLDPLTVFKDRYDCIWTADALRKTALQRLREIHEPHDRRSESTSALLHKTFTPITPETRDVFLQVPKMKSETVRSLPERRDIRLV